MSRISKLVPGNDKRLAPRSEIQSIELPHREANSTFRSSARENFKLDTRILPDNPPYSVQETDNNLAASVTSQDVAMQQKWHDPLCPELSYDVVDSQEIKIVVFGDRFVGKSSLITRAASAKKNFSCKYKRTSCLEVYTKTVKIKGKLYVVNFWDPPNDTLVDDRQRKEFCQGAMAAFVMYDLSNLEKTLCTIVEWKKMINNTVCMENGDPIPVYLLGNKCDMEGCQKDGASFAEINGFAGHFRTSAKTGNGIEEAVKQVAKDILKKSLPHLPVIVETPDHLKNKR